MKLQLTDYVKVYKNHIDVDMCDKIVQELQSVEWVKHTFYDQRSGYYSHSDDFMNYGGVIPSVNDLMDVMWKGFERYIVKDLQFPWYDSWEGYSPPKFNRYDIGTKMENHCDHIHDLFKDSSKRGIPILTMVGALNDDYVGGEFILFGDKEYKLSKGDIIMFPSNFLYPHRVEHILNGTRYSFASWCW